MTLKTIADAVADEVGAEKPSTISGNRSPAAQQMLRLVNKVGLRLMRLYPWQILRKEKEFLAVSGEAQPNAFNNDFDRFIPETFWNRSFKRLLSGPITPVEWQGLKSYPFNFENPKFILRGGDIYTIPELGAGSEMAYEYVSKNWVVGKDNIGQTRMLMDFDVSLIDDDLVAVFVKYEWYTDEGMENEAAFAARAAQNYLNMLVDNDQPRDEIITSGDIFSRQTRHFTGTPKSSYSYLNGVF